VVLFDAPPAIGHNLQRAIDEVASASGVPGTVTHIVYSHHHAQVTGILADRSWVCATPA
jgi:glyoxylase-like metal-dependent hydrolase (beta-lactamase superfamily II)